MVLKISSISFRFEVIRLPSFDLNPYTKGLRIGLHGRERRLIKKTDSNIRPPKGSSFRRFVSFEPSSVKID
jgi:hypothetical protein